MVKSVSNAKKSALTLIEVVLSLTLLLMVLSPLSLASHKLLKKWRYQRDVNKLRSQLQGAYSLVLHCDVAVNVLFKETQKGIYCILDFQNASLNRKIKTQVFYPHIQRITLNRKHFLRPKLTFSPSGDYLYPVELGLIGENFFFQTSMLIKGYPHVLETKKS